MNIDLLPFSAFALESSGAASRHGEAHTLTLRLDLTPVHPAFAPAMGGSVGIDGAACGPAPVLRAAVVPAVGPVLTITF
ncbi:MAG: hypothetical protein Q8R01_14195 [Ramlibacter sp.]|nr:hypothetical protein [Ramlibacter sp.]